MKLLRLASLLIICVSMSFQVKETVSKGPETDFLHLMDFDDFFIKKWSVTLHMDASINDYLVSDGLLFTTDLLGNNNALDLAKGKIINIIKDSVFIKDKSRSDSIFLLKRWNSTTIYDAKKNKKICSFPASNRSDFAPDIIKDSLFVLKSSNRSVAAVNLKQKHIVWIKDSIPSDINKIYQNYLYAIVQTENELVIIEKYSGKEVWSAKLPEKRVKGYINPVWIVDDKIVLIDEANQILAGIALRSGDTTNIYKPGYSNMYFNIKDNCLFFTSSSQLYCFNLKNWKLKWKLGEKDHYYQETQPDNSSVYTFENRRLSEVNIETGKILMKTSDDRYGYGIIPAGSYILTELGGFQEGGMPVIIDKKNGKPLAVYFHNSIINRDDKQRKVLKNISISTLNAKVIQKDLILVCNFENGDITYTLLDRK
jgi:outer membrane protein assembly factor BamB